MSAESLDRAERRNNPFAVWSLTPSSKRKRVDLDNPDTHRIIKQYEDAAKERLDQSVHIAGATVLGSILDSEDVYAVSVIVIGTAEIEGKQTTVPISTSTAWIRRGKQVIELSDLEPFEGSKSINDANNILVEWVRAFSASNSSR
jgi:hypothetical protein